MILLSCWDERSLLPMGVVGGLGGLPLRYGPTAAAFHGATL